MFLPTSPGTATAPAEHDQQHDSAEDSQRKLNKRLLRSFDRLVQSLQNKRALSKSEPSQFRATSARPVRNLLGFR